VSKSQQFISGDSVEFFPKSAFIVQRDKARIFQFGNMLS